MNLIELPKLSMSAAYELAGQRDADWTTSKNRVLIVLQTVPTEDLKADLLGSTKTLGNAIKFAKSWARRYNPELPKFSFGVINYNAAKHLELNKAAKASAESAFKIRAEKLIKDWNPTHILFSGDMSKLWEIENSRNKVGWVHDLGGRKVVQTFDLSKLLDKQGLYANCLGFFCRHLAHLLLGYHPHSLKGFKPHPIYIDTIEKYEKMITRWVESPFIAVDTETKDLSVNFNKIYTIQFCFESDPDRGFVIPIHHPLAKIDSEFRKYVKRDLQKRFGASSGPTLVMFNGMFDIRVILKQFKLEFLRLKIWEITAGEHLLDENVSSLASIGLKSGGLLQTLCNYESDFYLRASFSKEERSQTGSTDPKDPDFLKYCLPRGQVVLTKDGRVPIQDIFPGTLVSSFNHKTQTAEYKPVTSAVVHKNPKRLVAVSFGAGKLIVTEDHPIWSVTRNQYIPAGKLFPGERLKLEA